MPRFRSNPVDVERSIYVGNTNWQQTLTETTQDSVLARLDSMTDEVSPGYFSREARNAYQPINAMSKTTYGYFANNGTTKWERQWIGNPGTPYDTATMTGDLALVGYWSSGLAFNADPIADSYSLPPAWPADSAVSVPALANARAAGMDVGTAVAELGKTVRMLQSFTNNVGRRANNIAEALVRRRRFTSTEAVLNGFSETWLEGRYGWRTLAFELEDLTEALLLLQSLGLKRVRGYAEEQVSGDYSSSATNISLNKPKFQTSWSSIARGNVVISREITRTKRSGSIIDAICEGLAFVDPLVTLHEVIPYSFILDWIVNINDNIAAFSPFATGRRLGSWVSATEEEKVSITLTPQKSVGGSSYIHLDPTGPVMYSSVSTRTEYNRYPVDPSFSLTFDLNIDASKIVDLVSIALLKHARLLRRLTQSVRV